MSTVPSLAEAIPNRVHLLTPPGGAAIAVVRLGGQLVAPFLAAHFSRPVAPLRCVHGELRDQRGEVIDDALVVLHEDGRTADLNVHGGPWVIESVIELARRKGFRYLPAEMLLQCPQLEQPEDAPSLLEREVWANAPLARTEQGLRVLLAQPKAWADLIEQAKLPAAAWRPLIVGLLSDCTLNRLLHPAHVAIIGPPNVGKSTLANQLFAQERSITADAPGTTRDWVGEIANIDGVPVMLFDTPGARETDDPIEAEAIRKSEQALQRVELALSVSELHAPPGPETPFPALPLCYHTISVVNKVDLLPDYGRGSGRYACFVSAKTGRGVDRLRQVIHANLGCDDLDPARPRVWTQRQREILRRSMDDPGVIREIVD